MAYKIRMKRGVNVGRVVSKLVATVIALWVGGTIMTEVGSVMECTQSAFYDGLSLIGWTVSDAVNTSATCSGYGLPNPANNVITATTGTGVLGVIGIIGIAAIVLEFVQFKL